MSMEIARSFVVRAPADQTWTFLTDPRRVASCLPGAAVTGDLGDGQYAGTITVKVGPVAATYKGTMRFEKLDAGAGVAELSASGLDVRGKGGADMRMTSRLVERAPGETEVSVVSQVNVMGVLAQFGRGMIQDVSDQMFQRFEDAMRAQLETPEAVLPTPGPPPAAAGTPPSAATSASVRAEGPAAAAPAPLPTAPPIEVVSFGSRVVGRAVSRAARRPVTWLIVAAVLLLIWWLSR
jgi:carbon monoxide dehydrogenase subunit G